MQTSSACALCSRCISSPDPQHQCTQCTEKLYSLITKIIKPKNNASTLFSNITNLVFQGGGVKGVAYLGALEQLQKEGERNCIDFLGGVKRIAGTSAGSITALYLGLGLDVNQDIRPLMERGYDTLLDDGLVLKVKLERPFLSWGPAEYKNFRAKHIVLKTLKYFEDLNTTLESSEDPRCREKAQKDLQDAVNKVFRYYGEKLGFFPSLALKIKGSAYASDVVEWLFNFLAPPKKIEPSKIQFPEESASIKQEFVKKGSGDDGGGPLERIRTDTTNDTQNPSSARLASILTPGKIFPSYFSSRDGEPETGSPGSQEAGFRECSKLSMNPIPKANSRWKEIVSRECSGIFSERDIQEICHGEEIRAYSTSPQAHLAHDQADENPERIQSPDGMNNNYGGFHMNIIERKNPNPDSISQFDLNRVISNVAPSTDMNGNYFGGVERWCRENPLQNQANQGQAPPPTEKTVPEKKSLFPDADLKKAEEKLTNKDKAPEFPPLSFVKRGISVGPDCQTFKSGLGTRTCSIEKGIPANHLKGSNGAMRSQNSQHSFKEPSIVEEKNLIPVKEDDAKEYIERSRCKNIAAAPEAELTWDLLPTALGELLWFIIISQQNAAGVQEQLGVFNGSVVKTELIEKPMINRILKLKLVPKINITFKELMDYNAVLPEENKFKQFYVTAFNTETSKTEVFSAEHTPNVVIADAVRASMSIPVFFTPVTIREKDALGGLQERTYFNGVKRTVVHYMDGGILDNYPLWIFDDFKYCFDEDLNSGTTMKYSIQNPNTLGFRLLDAERIQEYTNPRFLGKVVTGEEKSKEFKEKFSYQIGLLLNAVANEAQENEHLKRGDNTRSVYVDNRGISSIAFSLGAEQREALIESGRRSVKHYQCRAKKNFNGEGQIHE